MKIVFSSECLEYKFERHPESPERTRKIYESLREAGYSFTKPEKATQEDILLVHTLEHYKGVKEKKYFDLDTPPLEIKYPLISVGGALKAAKILGFSICRPPGHHAGRNFLGGFCYFNNIAIAVTKLNKKAAILDLDVHHGNGTQDIFLGSKNVLYVSLHQYPLYPGTGKKSIENCINFPLPPGTSEETYLKTLGKALGKIEEFKPEILAISMGFDTFYKDPLANFLLKEESYFKIGKKIASLQIPLFIVLEGGYSEEIGKLALKFLEGIEL